MAAKRSWIQDLLTQASRRPARYGLSTGHVQTPGNWRQSNSSTMASALESTQAIRSSRVVSAVPGQVSLSGQNSHQVTFWPEPPSEAQLPAVHVLFSTTVPPMF